jgi:hypothetical protein
MSTRLQLETRRLLVGFRVWELPRFINHVILLLGALVSGLLAIRTGKDLNWDLFNYHFYNGWAILTGHTWTNIAPAQLQSFFNPALDILQYLLIVHVSPWWVTFIIGAFQGISIFLVFAIVRGIGRFDRSLFGAALALLPAVVALTGPMAKSELGSTMGDLTLAVPVLLSVLLIIATFNPEDQRNAKWKVIVAGGCLGGAVGFKYVLGPYAAAAAGALLIRPPPSMSRASAIIGLGIGGTIGFAVIAGPWMLMLDAHYGSPTLPFFNAWFRSPWMIDINWSGQVFPFADWRDWIVFPFSLIREGTHHLQLSFRSVRLALAWCCILASACLALSSGLWTGLSGRRLRPVAGTLLPSELWLYLYFGLSYVFWAKFYGDYRYFIPAEMLTPVIVVLTIGQFSPRRAVQAGIVAVAALGMVTFESVGSWGRGPLKTGTYFGVGDLRHTIGKDTMVVMTGLQGTAFLIPFFDESIRFVRLESNYTGLQSEEYARQLSKTVAEHRGPRALLTTADVLAESANITRQYGLQLNKESCQPIQSVYALQIVLCQLVPE